VSAIADAALAAGHTVTARELYWKACDHYREAQHSIFRDDDSEKIYLHGRLLDCFAKLAPLCPNPVEVVEIPFEGTYVQGVLNRVPGDEPRPTAVFCPGMDMTKESWLIPWDHPFVARGMHCLHLDGPGQGTSNIRKLRVTLDNYERAGSAAIDYLVDRPEVDAEQIVVAGFSMGSYWGMRLAARDPRVRAVATAAACYGPKRAIFEEASPRFKQTFMYMSGIHDEIEFDRFAAQMTLDDVVDAIVCPSLQVAGEYDPLCHLEDVFPVYERLRGPKELWVVENSFHNPRFLENFGEIDFWGYLADWLLDVLAGRKPADLAQVLLIRQREGLGPYSTSVDDVYLPGRIGAAAAELTSAQLGPAS
jgi:pimeloyl-ACP methyl ester carboxylesterase